MTPNQPLDASAGAQAPQCPKCSGPMWDNREGKRNPKAPDFKCKDKSCDGVIWPPRNATGAAAPVAGSSVRASSAPVASVPASKGNSAAKSAGAVAEGQPACPICGGPMWDDRATKRNPRAPDFKCKNKPRERGGPGCEGVIWPPRDGKPSPYPVQTRGPARPVAPPRDEAPPPDDRDAPSFEDDDLPF